MVRHIKYGILVAEGIVADVQTALVIQRIGHLDGGVAGEALVAVGAVQTEGDGRFCVLHHLPQPQVIEVRAAVKIVAPFIGGDVVGFSCQGKAGVLQTVGVAAHGGTQTGTLAGAVAVAVIIAKHHICIIAVGIGNHQGHKGSTVIRDGSTQTAAADPVQAGFLAGGQIAEKFFHGKVSLHFYPEIR